MIVKLDFISNVMESITYATIGMVWVSFITFIALASVTIASVRVHTSAISLASIGASVLRIFTCLPTSNFQQPSQKPQASSREVDFPSDS